MAFPSPPYWITSFFFRSAALLRIKDTLPPVLLLLVKDVFIIFHDFFLIPPVFHANKVRIALSHGE